MVDPANALRPRHAAGIVSALLLAVYVLTLAPGVTYWDSGEFLAAMKSLGIPHPPGTPLYILIGNVWGRALEPIFGFAYAVNLFSAVCTAIACGLFAFLMARWTRDVPAAIAGGILAGLMSSVWLNANETEVYAPALLMSALFLFVADKANQTREGKWLVLLAYLLALGWTLQLSALVAAPAALLLAFSAWRSMRIPVMPMIIVALLGATVVLFMLVRAQHDPGVNQGNPETWSAFTDVLTRKQYQPVSLLPRQAPWYIQIGNLFEYADWQVAFGLHPYPPPSIVRTSLTVVYAILGGIGFLWHRRADVASWRVMTFLFVCATLGVIAYLNMKASPSYGHGFLPAGVKHEARERDYFFALAFVCWGLWAGGGAVELFKRSWPRRLPFAFAIALLPGFLNLEVVDRRRDVSEVAARDSALRILRPAPPRAVIFAYGDNDTYPVWYAQIVEGVRRDVTTVTVPLLGAEWYRAELSRRHGLLTEGRVQTWEGFGQTIGRDLLESAECRPPDNSSAGT